MTVVMNEAGLSSISLPCFVQSFVNHNAVLWKVYVVGAEHFLVKRPSIKNLYPNPGEVVTEACGIQGIYIIIITIIVIIIL